MRYRMPVYLALQNMFLRLEAIIPYLAVHSFIDSFIHEVLGSDQSSEY